MYTFCIDNNKQAIKTLSSIPLSTLEQCHPEIGAKGVHVKPTADPTRSDKEAGPAVMVEGSLRRPLEEVAGKVLGNPQLPGQLWAVQGQTPVKKVPRVCNRTYHDHILKYLGIITCA